MQQLLVWCVIGIEMLVVAMELYQPAFAGYGRNTVACKTELKVYILTETGILKTLVKPVDREQV